MRAMRLEALMPVEAGPLVDAEHPVPEPAAGEVRVRVTACGVCRTDLHIVEGELPPARLPIVPGHQIVGRVERLGPAATRFRPGQRVGIAWLRSTCGRCRFCRSERENLCEHAAFTGYHADGGFAEYAVVSEAFAYPIPDVFSDSEAAPLLCAGIIGYRALRLSGVEGQGGRLGMYGFGSSAHITLQVALARGIEVYVCTRGPAHRSLARTLGAAWVGDVTEAMPPTEAAIVFAPAGELVPGALRRLAPGGRLVLAGIHMTTIPALEYADLYHERSITSVTANTRADGEGLLADAARIPIRPTVTPFGLAEANEALRQLKHEGFAGSAVLIPDRV